MATFSANGVNLYYEETGEGFPLVWSHEFAGNYPSWDPQVRFFSRRYRVITYSARGYPPSDVPEDPDAYSQDLVVEDLYLLLRHLRIDEAYIGGLSMGGIVALNFAIAHPEMCRGIIVASVGSGSDDREAFLASAQVVADRLLSEGMAAVAHDYARGEARLQFLRMAGVSRRAGGPLGPRFLFDLSRLPDEASHRLRPRGKPTPTPSADPDHDWRRRRTLC